MAYENLFVDSKEGDIIPFNQVRCIKNRYICLIGGTTTHENYIHFLNGIPEDQLSAYRLWLNASLKRDTSPQ